MKSKTFLLLIAFALVLHACGGAEEQAEETQTQEVWQPEMDQPSELAQIMRDIHDEAKTRKAALAAGEMDATEATNILRMLSATPTEPHMVGAGFQPNAEVFIRNYEALHATTSSVADRIKAHNNLVDACIACHNQFCSGPIPRITKLYIE